MTETRTALSAIFLAATLMAASPFVVSPANAAVLTAANGMTLYSFDADSAGKPTCNGFCASAWPPYLAGGEKKGKGWTTVARSNGALQWAYDGRPVYFYAGDRAKGDTKGNGLEGTWHIIND